MAATASKLRDCTDFIKQDLFNHLVQMIEHPTCIVHQVMQQLQESLKAERPEDNDVDFEMNVENSEASQDLDVLYTALEKDNAPIAITEFLELLLRRRGWKSGSCTASYSIHPPQHSQTSTPGHLMCREGGFLLTSRQVDLNPNTSVNILRGYARLRRTCLPHTATVENCVETWRRARKLRENAPSHHKQSLVVCADLLC